MRTVRRLYFYLLTLIGSQALVWGTVNLLRNLLHTRLSTEVDTLASGFSLILVGLPVFWLHWRTIQRSAASEEEERASRMRAVFFYVLRTLALLPVTLSLMSLINRLFAGLFGLNVIGELFGGDQSTADSLITIGINLLLFAFFERTLRADWRAAPAGHFLAEARRLYRYFWLVYGISLTVFGVFGLLRTIFSLLENAGSISGYLLTNSLALTLVGAPMWSMTWQQIQISQRDAPERQSILRLVVLYLINLAGVVGVLSAGGRVLSSLFAMLLGNPLSLSELSNEVSPSLALVIPMAVMWAYYWRILDGEMTAQAEQPRRAGIRRLYYALLSALGLAVTFTALVTLISFIAASINANPGWGRLSGGLAALAIGLPLWLADWLPLQKEAAEQSDNGERARRAIVRRTYLYLAVFLFVIGLMAAAGDLIYNLVTDVFGSPVPGMASLAVERLLTSAAVGVFLAYHLRALQQDARAAQQALSGRQADFPVLLVIDADGHPLAGEVANSLYRQAPYLPLRVISLPEELPTAPVPARLVVLPSALAADPPAALRTWLNDFPGKRLILPQEQPGWIWLGFTPRPLRELAEETAAALRQMAEGDIPRAGLPSNPWAVVGYVLGAIFALQILLVLFSIMMSGLFN